MIKNFDEFITESVSSELKKAAKEISKLFNLDADTIKDAVKNEADADEIYNLCADNALCIYWNKDGKGVAAAKKNKFEVFAQGKNFMVATAGDDRDKEMWDLAIDTNEMFN